jgi:hypothetical protein
MSIFAAPPPVPSRRFKSDMLSPGAMPKSFLVFQGETP